MILILIDIRTPQKKGLRMRTIFSLVSRDTGDSRISLLINNAPPGMDVSHTFDLAFLESDQNAEIVHVHWHGGNEFGGLRRLTCLISSKEWNRLVENKLAIPDPKCPGHYLINEWNWGQTIPKTT